MSAGVGAKSFPFSWLAASAYFPYKWNTGRDRQTDREVDLKGIGDFSFAASFDLLEFINPTMIRIKCPETGGPIVALMDEDDFIKSPHLSFTAGLSVPVGKEDNKQRWWVIPPQYQPGSGVWMFSAGAHYSHGIGPVTPSVGTTYILPGGKNSAGFEAPDSLMLSASLNWLFWYDRMAKLYTAVNAISPMSKARQDGTEIKGSDARLVLLDIGASLWVVSFWEGSRKVTAGLLLTLPLVEGTSGTARIGTGVGAFCTFSI